MPDVTESTRQQPEEPARRAVEILARALTEAEAALTTPPPAPSEAPPSPEAEAPATSPEGTDALLRTLIDHFDRALDRLAEERRVLVDEVLDATRSLRSYVERVESRMDRDRELLTEKIAALAQAVERLEQRPAAETPPAAPPPAPEAQLPAAADETPTAEGEVFRPGEDSLTVVVSAVPGFQGLMEAQRALTRLPAVQGASVERYFNGEARIVLSLREPVSATRLAETLSEATGQETQVEEARPEALRLRVRFREPTD